MIKPFGLLALGPLIGVAGSVFYFSYYIQETHLSTEISFKSEEIWSFLLVDKLTEKKLYCYRYKNALNSSQDLPALIKSLNKSNYSSSNHIVIIPANKALAKFAKVSKDNIQYECENT